MRLGVLTSSAALAAGVVAGAIVSVRPAMASTVTENITFSAYDTYPVNYPLGPNDLAYFFQGTTVSGSFQITFDPAQNYTDQSISGFISNIVLSVQDPYFNAPPTLLTLNPITSFTYNTGGNLILDSTSSLSKAMTVTDDVTLGFNGISSSPNPSAPFDIWYSQGNGTTGFGDTITTFGGTAVSATPLPSTWTMIIAGFVGLGLLVHRRSKKNISAIAAAVEGLM